MQMIIKGEQEWLNLHQTKQILSQKLSWDKGGHYIIKQSIDLEVVAVKNKYAGNIRVHKYIKQCNIWKPLDTEKAGPRGKFTSSTVTLKSEKDLKSIIHYILRNNN